MARSPTKKQHIVPKSYLKRFANSQEFVYVLDLKNKRIGKPRPYASIGYAFYYYAVETGKPDPVAQLIENWLQAIETTVFDKLPEIIETIKNGAQIKENHRYMLAVLMSMLWLRTPGMRGQLNQMRESFEKQMLKLRAPYLMESLEKDTGRKWSIEEKDAVLKMVESGDYKFLYNNAEHLKFMVETLGLNGPGFANMFYGMNWKIVIAQGSRRFITTDNPVVEWWLPPTTFYGAGFMQRNKYFALTPELFIECTDPGSFLEKPRKAKRKTLFSDQDDVVKLYNLLIVHRAEQFAYGSDKSFLQDVLDGIAKPGPVEREYFKRFELPWVEYRRSRSG